MNNLKSTFYRKDLIRHIERPLKNTEIVHHLDHDRSNNSPENLYVAKDRKEHGFLHSSKHKKTMEIVFNNKNYAVFLEEVGNNEKNIHIVPNNDHNNKEVLKFNSKIVLGSKLLEMYFTDKIPIFLINAYISDEEKKYYQDHCKYCGAKIEPEFMYCIECDKRIK